MASDAQRPQVLHQVLTALRLGSDVIHVGFTLIGTHTPALLAGPGITHENTLTHCVPRL
jgi:hypothetical protein